MTQPLIHGSQIDQSTLDNVPGGFLGAVWKYQNDVASADPGNGNFRLNNLTTASATELYISSTTDDAHDFNAILNGLSGGDRLYIQDQADSARSLLLTITSTVDNTGWWTIVFTVDDSAGAFDDNQRCSVLTFMGSNSINSVVEDTSPQLGGNLDVNGSNIVSVSNADVNIVPDGTGKTKITNIEAPTVINAQVGTSYTAVLADADKMITLSNAGAIAMTIPANASVAYPIGTKLNFMQLGGGQVTVGITTDALNVEITFTLKLAGQYASATALKVTATSWVLFGNLEAV